jgi:hypothetical protein
MRLAGRRLLLGALVTVAACDATSSSTPPTTDAQAAPPASAGGFVAPPACDADHLAVWTAAVRIDQRASSADAVIRFEELSGERCELVLADPEQLGEAVEPNVVLDARGWAELVLGQGGRECTASEPVTSVPLTLADLDLVVPTAAVGMCGLLFTELLPSERPIEPCTGDDVTAVRTPSGFVVRNDGVRGCVLGGLDGVLLADGSTMPPTSSWTQPELVPARVGPGVDALAPGDVVLFPTFDSPVPDCTRTMVDARLVLSGGVEVAVEAPDACVFVDLGRARPWFGSPGGPLSDADRSGLAREWIGELDAFGDPCVTVPVAPPDLVDGAPILSPATISEDGTRRLATWGNPATNGVTQRLDVPIGPDSFEAGAADSTFGGRARRAAVVEDASGAVLVDVAELEGSCVRRYVLAGGTSLDEAARAARRWVA